MIYIEQIKEILLFWWLEHGRAPMEVALTDQN